jgi:hypothetical protein
LHKVLYDIISKKDWLLRGDADIAKFRAFLRLGGTYFCSGDYASATDNLPISVAERILHNFFARANVAQSLPTWLPQFALRSLRTEILDSEGQSHQHERGQLMGSLLSFPLLCIQNYVAFRYFVSREEVPDTLVKINGDDIVFRGRLETIDRWKAGVGTLGLELSSGKTFVDRNFFSLNSTYFWALRDRVELLPVVRFGLLACGRFVDIGRCGNQFVADLKLRLRLRALETYLRWYRSMIRKNYAPIFAKEPMGLGLRASLSEVRALNMLRDEADRRMVTRGCRIDASANDDKIGRVPGHTLVEFDSIDENLERRTAELRTAHHWSRSSRELEVAQESEIGDSESEVSDGLVDSREYCPCDGSVFCEQCFIGPTEEVDSIHEISRLPMSGRWKSTISAEERKFRHANWWFASNDEELRRVEVEIQRDFDEPPQGKRVRYLLSDEEIQMREQVDDDVFRGEVHFSGIDPLGKLSRYFLNKRFRAGQEIDAGVNRYGLWT